MAEARPLGADEVAGRDFATGFRGFDQHEVRAFLGRLAAELAALQARERTLQERLAAAEARVVPPAMGETELEDALGVETARVLHAARAAAAEIRGRAEDQVARLLRDAGADASRMREEAGSVLAERTAEAERVAAAVLEQAERDAAARRAEAEAAGAAVLEAAKEHGRQVVGEAQVLRERILRDLARRRRAGHQQLEQLRAGRDRMLEACRGVQRALDDAVGELGVSEAGARAAAETAGLRVAGEPELTLAELEVELTAAVQAGIVAAPVRSVPGDADAVSAPADGGDAGIAEEPLVAAAGPAGEPEGALPGEGPGQSRDGAGQEVSELGPRAAVQVPAFEPRASPPRRWRRRPVPERVVRRDGEDVGGDGGERLVVGEQRAPAAVVAPRQPGPPAPPAEPEQQEPVAEVAAVPPDDAGGVGAGDGSATETSLEDGGGTDATAAVDDVLARIRANRAAVVAHATAVLARDDAAADAGQPGAGDVAGAALATAFEQRDAAVEPHERALTRALKRVLADEQNELLDALRRARGAADASVLLPPVDEHEARYRAVGREPLSAAAAAGAGALDAVDLGEVLSSLGREVVAVLRPRLELALEAAAGDEVAASGPISAAYREWKTARAEPLARHHILAAHAAGAFAAAGDGQLRWVVDPEEGCSPDCADNALAGPTPKGEPFPTGHAHPPAHAGCRCLVVTSAH